jgi:hypothetical protein
VIVGFTYGPNRPQPSVTDDKGNAYAIVQNFYSSANSQSIGVAAAFNVAAGARKISLCFSSDPGPSIQPMASEFSNVVGIDGAGSGNSGASAVATGGTLTPSQSGDLLYQVVKIPSSGATMAAGAQMQLLSADIVDGWASQYGVIASAPVNPAMALQNPYSSGWLSASVLLKTGVTGSVPTGLRIVHLTHETVNWNYSPMRFQFPSSGNLLVAMWGGGEDYTIGGATDSNGNSWAQAGSVVNGSGNYTQTYYAGNAMPSNSLSLTFNMQQAQGGSFNMFLYDVAGAAASPLDVATGIGGDNPDGNPFLVPYTLAPTNANDIVFTQCIWASNTASGLSGQLLDTNQTSGEVANIDGIDENNGWGHVITTTTAPLSFSWQFLYPGGPDTFGCNSVAFKGQ